jgi:thymidylate synthase
MNIAIITIINIKKMIQTRYDTANDAFHRLYWDLSNDGEDFGDTKAFFNVGFYIDNPEEMEIKNSNALKRDWKEEYAEAEWQWYLSGNRNISKLDEIYGKVPKIWKRMADKHGDVNSNYGWQWKRNYQLSKVIDKLMKQPNTRQATISIYDGKEMNNYRYDTPCTYAIQFTVVDEKLNMCVTMRSNDLWYGFCNDQYCFASLQCLVSAETGYELGTYYHFAHNLHLYNKNIKHG